MAKLFWGAPRRRTAERLKKKLEIPSNLPPIWLSQCDIACDIMVHPKMASFCAQWRRRWVPQRSGCRPHTLCQRCDRARVAPAPPDATYRARTKLVGRQLADFGRNVTRVEHLTVPHASANQNWEGISTACLGQMTQKTLKTLPRRKPCAVFFRPSDWSELSIMVHKYWLLEAS